LTKGKNKSIKTPEMKKYLLIITMLFFFYGNVAAQLNRKTHSNNNSKYRSISVQQKPSSVLKSGNLANKPTLDSIIYSGYDISTNSWLPYYKEAYIYETDESSHIYYNDSWNAESNEWDHRSKTQVWFNEAGNMTLEARGSFSNGEYIPYETHSYMYNNNGLLAETIYSFYGSGTITLQGREIYEYEETNFVKWIKKYNRDSEGQQWNYRGKLEYEYDNQGKVTKVLMSDYDLNHDGINNNLDSRLTIYFYDDDGNMDSSHTQMWDEESNGWLVKSKTNFTYNSAGRVLTEKYYQLNEASSEFVLLVDDEWFYDTNNNRTAYYFREKSQNSEEWYGFKDSLIYDLNVLIKDYTLPYGDDEIDFTNKPIAYLYYERDDPSVLEWELLEKGKLYYSDDIQTTTNTIASPKINVQQSLNSFSASWDTNTNCMTLDMFNLGGKKVYNKQISNMEIITTDFLPNGLYIYKLSDRKSAVSGKLVVRY
jgi:hypothetical protein